MNEELVLKNRLKEIRAEKRLSQSELAEMVGVLFPPIRIRMKTARQGNLGRRRRECKPLQMGEFPSATGG